MKICIPVAIFPPEIGGPATYVPELARHLASRRHEVHVITFGIPGYEERDGYFIHRLPYPKLPKALALPLRIIKAGLLCARVIKRYNLEVIYAQEYLSGLIGVIAKKITGIPLYLKYVGDWAWEYGRSRGLTKKLLHEFYDSKENATRLTILKFFQEIEAKTSDGIIVPSGYLKSIVERWSKTPIKVVPNAIDPLECMDIKESKKITKPAIIAVGRLEEWKNFESLIKAMPLIRNMIPNANLYIIGEGPRKKKLESLAKKLNLDRVFFFGRLNRREVLECLKAGDVLVLPSYYEGMSHVILESMCCKTPVVASNACGNPEIVKDGETGLLIESDNIGSIVDAIVRIIENVELRSYLIENAYNMISSSNCWENSIKILEKIFMEKVYEYSNG
jgi:glycosyltransferase involved in cell wall biosynthesis